MDVNEKGISSLFHIPQQIEPSGKMFLILFGLSFGFYLTLGWFVLSPQALWSPDEGAKLLQLHSLRWENGMFAYDLLYPGRGLDPGGVYAHSQNPDDLFTQHGSRFYFQRLPLFPLLSRVGFALLEMPGLYILPALGGALCVTAGLGFLEVKRRRIALTLVLGLGSPVIIYASLFWEHTLASGLALLAAWILIDACLPVRATLPRTGGWVPAASVALFAISIYLRQEVVLFVGSFFLACWLFLPLQRARIFWVGAALGLALLPYPFLHRALFAGQAMPDNARYLVVPTAYARTADWNLIPDFLIGPPEAEAIEPGLLGWFLCGGTLLALVGSLARPASTSGRILQLIGLAITALVSAIFLFSPTHYRSAHGLLMTTPWVLLALCRARSAWEAGSSRLRIVVVTTLLGLTAYFIAIVGLRGSSPHGGLEWGARFALTFFPFLATLAVNEWEPFHSNLEIGVFLTLLALGVGFQVRGLVTIAQDKRLNADLNRAILNTSGNLVVSDLWWLTENSAPFFPRKAVFTAETPERLAAWVDQVSGQAPQSFILVTLEPTLSDRIAPLLISSRIDLLEEIPVQPFWILSLQSWPQP